MKNESYFLVSKVERRRNERIKFTLSLSLSISFARVSSTENWNDSHSRNHKMDFINVAETTNNCNIFSSLSRPWIIHQRRAFSFRQAIFILNELKINRKYGISLRLNVSNFIVLYKKKNRSKNVCASECVFENDAETARLANPTKTFLSLEYNAITIYYLV